MEVIFSFSLLAKVIWSAVIVLGLAFLAERVSTRIAGLISGAPLSAVLVYYFVAQDMGLAYAFDSVPHGIASFTATLTFTFAYFLTSLKVQRFSPLVSSVVGIAVYLATAAVMVTIPFSHLGAVALTVPTIALAIWLFRKIPAAPIVQSVHYTTSLILMRGSLAVALIVIVISLAEILGTRWAGLLAGFPSTLLPTLIILHVTYGTASTHAFIRNFPLGIGSIILYVLSVPVTFPLAGVLGGTLMSLALSLLYISGVVFWSVRRTP